MKKKVILMILDGWGICGNKNVSAISKANTPFVDSLYHKYPHAKLQASGLYVGLPEGQMGNSEVGHMNLGAGRVVFQDLVKINKAFEENTINENVVLLEAFEYAQKNNKDIHLMGLASEGGVHAHTDHLKGLLTIAKSKNIENVFYHAFTDGRDTDPKSGLAYLESIQSHMNETTGQVASVVGRYYAMDRDKRWERVKLAYDAMVNAEGEKATNILSSIKKSYAEGVTDEFIKPIIRTNENGEPLAKITSGDVVICYNYRTDRGREITEVLNQKDFPEFGMKKLSLHFVTMTNYDNTFNEIKVLFDKDNLKNTLGEVLAKAEKTQIRVAETEKYPHVTFFFSGGREEIFEGESRILVPSPKVATYDLKPEMSAEEIKNRTIKALNAEQPDFVCLNFANPDMVGHTGVFDAAVKAAETVDRCAEEVVKTALNLDYTVLVLADHGNSEFMINKDGTPNTAHTTNLVPFIVVDKEYKGKVKDGKLGDVAPTILKFMGVDRAEEMSGDVLISEH